MVRISTNGKYFSKHMQRVKQAGVKVSYDVKNTIKYYNNNFNNGWQIGKRLGEIKHYNAPQKLGTKLLGAASKTKVKKEHLPALLGGIGLLTPLPGGSLLGFSIGKLINRLAKLIK